MRVEEKRKKEKREKAGEVLSAPSEGEGDQKWAELVF